MLYRRPGFRVRRGYAPLFKLFSSLVRRAWGLRSREGPWPSVAFVLLAASLLMWAVGLTSRLDREKKKKKKKKRKKRKKNRKK